MGELATLLTNGLVASLHPFNRSSRDAGKKIKNLLHQLIMAFLNGTLTPRIVDDAYELGWHCLCFHGMRLFQYPGSRCWCITAIMTY